ncbi:MAG: dipicolinate synthase subunit B [Ruminococcaceae bacterium]|nr:dipicolinate synthase subunit B [Oscillospiraceae bacterium]
MIGFAMCGSFCTHKHALAQMKLLLENGREILPIMSENVYSTDTRFGTSRQLIDEVEQICGRRVVHTIVGAEPLGPSIALDAMVICPCTGNTLAKMASGITDTSVTMAAKAHLRSDRPLVIALATNDALSANLKNIGQMLTKKHVYFVPMSQDDPQKKPHSLVADFSLVLPALEAAEQGKQYQRIFK